MKKPKEVTLHSKCIIDCSCCDRVVLRIDGSTDENGIWSPAMCGDITFEDAHENKHLSFLKKGKSYNITIYKVR